MNFTACELYLPPKVQMAQENLRSLPRKDLPVITPPQHRRALQVLPWPPLTWVVVGCDLVDHGGILGVGAEGGQNYSCGERQG